MEIKNLKFAITIEEVCIGYVESGSMTKDLAILVGPSSKYLTTNQFLLGLEDWHIEVSWMGIKNL